MTGAFVRIDNGSWYNEYDDDLTCVTVEPFNYINDTEEHLLELKIYWEDGRSSVFDFQIHIVPERQKFYYDGQYNYMSYWQGGENEFDRPFLIVEGFDPTNLNYPSFYYYKANVFFEEIKDNNSDIFMLDFADGGDDIATNAQIVKSAIKYLEQIREGDQPIMVAGLSMGGVVCRYALAESEDPNGDNEPLDVSHFISIDSPQQYATIEQGFQDYIDDKDDGEPVDALNSTAAKQMLHYNTYCSPTIHENFYDILNNLNGDGYPHANDIKNIGVSFSPYIENPHSGKWAYVNINNLPDEDFYFDVNDYEHKAGSWLPVANTKNWGYGDPTGTSWFNFFWYEVERTDNHPTFIPYESALDLDEYGASKFDIILASAEHGFHDVFPTGLDTDGQVLVEHLMDILYLSDESDISVQFYNKLKNGDDAAGDLYITASDGSEDTVSSGDEQILKANYEHNVKTLEQKRLDFEQSGNNYQHHDWNKEFDEFFLNHNFEGWHNGGKQEAFFNPTHQVSIEMFGSGMELNEEIEFKDPWYVDGNNQQTNSFIPFQTPFEPTGNYYESQGAVFLNQPYTGANPVYYSVLAPEEQTIPFHNENITWYFQNWTGSDVDFEHADQNETAVVFQQP
ncbi:MAG: hypothetical protein GF313_00105, partial [Caldithrix sp.]|nr:hypothetical protein [Caldithrix sp.]